MKIVSYSVVGQNESKRWLEKFLKHIKPLVDEVTVCLNNADKETEMVVRRYADYVAEDNREWGKNQWRIKQDYLNKVATLDPDWIVAMDCDEFLDKRLTREKLEELANVPNQIAYKLWCIQLYNDERHWREDLSFENVRFYKFAPEYGLHFESQPLHCGIAPVYAYKFATSTNFIFRHYGLMLPEDRKRKVERYAKYDPKEQYIGKSWYQALRNEKPLIKEFKEEDIYPLLPDIVFKKKLPKIMKKNVKIYMFRNPHGKIIPAAGEATRDQYLRTKGFTLLQEVVNSPRIEAPVINVELPIEPVDKPKKKRGRKKKNEANIEEK